MARTVAVVGGGCSGVLLARELRRCTDDRVLVIEPDEPGGGIAYGAARPWHLLNSRAGAMSADPDDPGHFVRWSGAAPADFVSRPRYGDYLRSLTAGMEIVRARATGIAPDGTVTLDHGAPIRAGRVVLATGGPAGTRPAAAADHPAYLADPWVPGAVESLPGDVPVLLIGTGLTAVDVALTLTADGRRSAPVVMVSRRGRLPLSHTVAAAPPAAPDLDDCATLRDVVRAVRRAAAGAADWRAVVDGLRPYLDELWVSFTPAEQDAFLRHLARHWECHRHRMAPAVAATVARLRADGVLRVRSGGLRSLTPAPDGGLVADAGTGPERFGAVVNCAGPGRLPGAASGLVGGLLATGQARVGPHGLGLDVDAGGRLRTARGAAHDRLWLIGPLRRGARWETTAVPEIRAQARRLALDLGGAGQLAAAA